MTHYQVRHFLLGKSDFKSKIDTARSFISNMNIALRYAPTEGFWTFYGLVKGQL